MKRTIIAITLYSLAVISLVFFSFTLQPRDTRASLVINNTRFFIDNADTPQLKEQGLSGRPSLKPNEGMWFVFDKDGFYPFWMKDMKFPIDIVWVNSEFVVVDITANLSPSTYPQTYQSTKPIQYVLELGAGVAEKKIRVGDKVILSGK